MKPCLPILLAGLLGLVPASLAADEPPPNLWKTTLTVPAGGTCGEYQSRRCRPGDAFTGEAVVQTDGLTRGRAQVGLVFQGGGRALRYGGPAGPDLPSESVEPLRVRRGVRGVAPDGADTVQFFIQAYQCNPGARVSFDSVAFRQVSQAPDPPPNLWTAALKAPAGGVRGDYRSLPCRPGEAFRGEAYVQTTGMTRGSARIQLAFFGAGGALRYGQPLADGVSFESGAPGSGAPGSGAPGRVRVGVRGTAPAGTDMVQFYLQVWGCNEGARGDFDSVAFQRVLPPAPGPAPVISNFSPDWGGPGTTITLRGAHLRQVQSVRLGDQAIPAFGADPSGTLMLCTLPDTWKPAYGAAYPFILGWSGSGPGAPPLREVTSASTFLAVAAQPVAATLSGFEPAWGRPGDRVTVTGTHLDAVRGVRIGNFKVPASNFRAGDGGRTLELRLPSGWDPRFTIAAPIALTTSPPGLGTRRRMEVQSGMTFRVLRRLARCSPGPDLPDPVVADAFIRVGHYVILSGKDLDRVREVRVGGVPVENLTVAHGAVAYRSPDGPGDPDPVTGLITLTYRGGSADFPELRERVLGTLAERLARSTASDERKGPPGPGQGGPAPAEDTSKPLTFGLPCLYLTQAVQRRDGSVPLVAGRDACLRAFPVASRRNQARPKLRIALRDAGQRLLQAWELPAAGPGVPTAMDENRLEGSWNVLIRGELIRPGNTIQAELLPDLPGAAPCRFPADGNPMPMNVVVVPPIRITLVPVRWQGAVGNVDQAGRTLESWSASLRKLLPVGEVDLRVGDLFDFVPASADLDDALDELVRVLDVKRQWDDPWDLGYLYGVYRKPATLGTTGSALRPKISASFRRTAVGWDGVDIRDNFTYFETFAHELGHTFGLRHAPAGAPENPDPDYPHPQGLLDASGFDVAEMSPKDPAQWTDIMGYGDFRWISAHNWIRALEHLSRPLELHAQALRNCLLVRGSVDGDRVLWEPAFELPGRTGLPQAEGEYRLHCLDRAGRVLARVPFAAEADEVGGRRGFEFLVPMSPALERSLAGFQVTRSGHRLDLVGAWNGRPLAPGGELGQPQARKAGSRITLRWDAAVCPQVLVVDPGSGRALAALSGGDGEVGDPGARELELRLSDGIRTRVLRIPVQ